MTTDEGWSDLSAKTKINESPQSHDTTGTLFEGIHKDKLCTIKQLQIRAAQQSESLIAWHSSTTQSTPFSPLLPTPIATLKPHWLIMSHLPLPQNFERYILSLPTYILDPSLEQLRMANLLIKHMTAWWIELNERRARQTFALIALQPNSITFCPSTQELWLTSFDHISIPIIRKNSLPLASPYTLPEWNQMSPPLPKIQTFLEAEGWSLLTTLFFILTREAPFKKSFGNYYLPKFDSSKFPPTLQPHIVYLYRRLEKFKDEAIPQNRPTLDQIINEWYAVDSPLQIAPLHKIGTIWSERYSRLVTASTHEAQGIVAKHFTIMGPAPLIPQPIRFPTPIRTSVSWLYPTLLALFISDHTRLALHPLRIAMVRDAIVISEHHPYLFEINTLIQWIETNQTPTLYNTNQLIEALAKIWHDPQIIQSNFHPQKFVEYLARYCSTFKQTQILPPPNPIPPIEGENLIWLAHPTLAPHNYQTDSALFLQDNIWTCGIHLAGVPHLYDARLDPPLQVEDWTKRTTGWWCATPTKK